MVESWCSGCDGFMLGENFLAKCWYSGCSLIVFGIKYILHLFLCMGGWACSRLGMGPGLVSMSPHSRSISSSEYVKECFSLCLGCLLCTMVGVFFRVIFLRLVCCFILFLLLSFMFLLRYVGIFILYIFLFVPGFWAGLFARAWFVLLVFICVIGGVCFGVFLGFLVGGVVSIYIFCILYFIVLIVVLIWMLLLVR